MKLGKTPARPGAVKLKLANYIDASALPKPPANFGHERLVTKWGVLGNDTAGCCVWAGAGHEVMLWNREAGKTANITAVAKRDGSATIITWGQPVPLTAKGYQQFNDESLAYLTEEKLVNGKSLEGFDLATLRADLTKIAAA